ncbi:MAG: DUF167 domain-containing protein [Candidatus Woesearchaeota archaeon]
MARQELDSLVKDNLLRVKVKPNASKTEIIEILDGKVIIAIKAPADKNKANAELVRFLSKELKRQCRIKSGLTSREKTIAC